MSTPGSLGCSLGYWLVGLPMRCDRNARDLQPRVESLGSVVAEPGRESAAPTPRGRGTEGSDEVRRAGWRRERRVEQPVGRAGWLEQICRSGREAQVRSVHQLDDRPVGLARTIALGRGRCAVAIAHREVAVAAPVAVRLSGRVLCVLRARSWCNRGRVGNERPLLQAQTSPSPSSPERSSRIRAGRACPPRAGSGTPAGSATPADAPAAPDRPTSGPRPDGCGRTMVVASQPW